MLKPSWDLVTYPVQAVFTGRVDGMEVSRKPLHWLPLWIAALVIPPILLVLYPVYVMIVLIGEWLFLRQGNDARITKAGIEVFPKRKGLIGRHDWRDVRSVSLLDDPPGTYPQITLPSSEIGALHLAGFDRGLQGHAGSRWIVAADELPAAIRMQDHIVVDFPLPGVCWRSRPEVGWPRAASG